MFNQEVGVKPSFEKSLRILDVLRLAKFLNKYSCYFHIVVDLRVACISKRVQISIV
jgi:hypothetical protein